MLDHNFKLRYRLTFFPQDLMRDSFSKISIFFVDLMNRFSKRYLIIRKLWNMLGDGWFLFRGFEAVFTS